MEKIIYCDFDGTITKEDTVNKFFEIFADPKWLEIEEKWLKKQIGSKECLLEQVAFLPEITQDILQKFINSIEIDEHFINFYDFIKKNGYKLVILSDGFDIFIQKTLEKYNLSEIKYFANSIKVENNKIQISFENCNPDCKNLSGSCKCSKVEVEDFCYIGDGFSDVCIAQKANILFAKKNLKKFCEDNNKEYINFNTFEDILNYFSQVEITL